MSNGVSGRMIQALLWLLTVGLIVAAVCLIRIDRRETTLMHLRLKKMRSHDLYHELSIKLRQAAKHCIESIEVNQEQVRAKYFYPEQGEIRFDFARRGFKRLTIEQTQALALLIETEHPMLKERAKYHFHRNTVVHSNGTKSYKYFYTIRNDYKTALCRAPYYSGSTSETLILKRNY